MIFRHDCGQCASVTGWQPLSFRLRVGHFSIVAIRPLLGDKIRLVGRPLAERWLRPAPNRRLDAGLLPHDQSGHSSRGLFGEGRNGVGVDIQSNGDRGMSQAIRYHLGMNASL